METHYCERPRMGPLEWPEEVQNCFGIGCSCERNRPTEDPRMHVKESVRTWIVWEMQGYEFSRSIQGVIAKRERLLSFWLTCAMGRKNAA
jgi:hypothetical protein